MKQADLHVDLLQQRGLQRDHFTLGFTDQEDFGAALRREKPDEPIEPRVLAKRVTQRGVRATVFGEQLTGDPGELREIVFHGERHRAKLPLGKARHGGAGVAKHHATRAVLVEQGLKQALPRARPAVRQRVEVLGQAHRIAVKDPLERSEFLRLERLLADDLLRHTGHRTKTVGLGLEFFEVRITMRVEQAQPRKMPE